MTSRSGSGTPEREGWRQNESVLRRVSLSVESVEASDRRATVHGEVWLGPIVVGDYFKAASQGDEEKEVRLRLAEITEPSDTQEVGRAARVIAVVSGDGVEFIRAGVVLLGEVDRS